MPCIRHETSVRNPCIQCMGSAHDVSNQIIRSERTNSDTTNIRAEVDRKFREEDNLTNRLDSIERMKLWQRPQIYIFCLSLALWPSFLEILMSSLQTVMSPEIHSILYFVPLYKLHLEVSVFLKSCLMTYLELQSPILFPRGSKTYFKILFRTLRTLFGGHATIYWLS